MVGHQEIEAKQVHDRPEQALGLAPRPPERQPEHQPGLDGDVRVGRPRRPVAAGTQAAMASGVTQTVRLPRRRIVASYSAQFSILYRALGILWRRGSFASYGIRALGCSGPHLYLPVCRRDSPTAIFAPRSRKANISSTMRRLKGKRKYSQTV